MNLDGETNLKERLLPYADKIDPEQFTGEILCDLPNENLEEWDANLSSKVFNKIQSCSIKNMLLRGCFLRNTPYATGVVIYVGPESKIMKNMKKAPTKVSNMMKKMNYMLYSVFLMQIALILIYSIAGVIWDSAESTKHTYL